MSLVFAAVCSHAPGITGRTNIADPAPQSCVSHRKTKRLRDATLSAPRVSLALAMRIAAVAL
jgi:hypothetical protein